jgi:glycosyltransferase involved in cell wall biosynthesis
VPKRDFLHVHGFLSKERDLPRLLDIIAACDFGVLLSDAEGFPSSVLEFLSCGVPVLCSNLPQVVERVGGKGAVLFERSNPIPELTKFLARALRDRSVVTQLRGNAENYWDEYTWRTPANIVIQALLKNGSIDGKKEI